MDYRALFEQTKKDRQLLVKVMPDVMSNMAKNTKISHSQGALDEKTKHLVSLGMSIMIACDQCVIDHVIHLYDLGCSREEFCECLEAAITLQSCPGLKYSQLALEVYDSLAEEDSEA